jgi:hypothetical protein
MSAEFAPAGGCRNNGMTAAIFLFAQVEDRRQIGRELRAREKLFVKAGLVYLLVEDRFG